MMFIISWSDDSAQYSVCAPDNKSAWMVYWMAKQNYAKQNNIFDVRMRILDSNGQYRNPESGERLEYWNGEDKYFTIKKAVRYDN